MAVSSGAEANWRSQIGNRWAASNGFGGVLKRKVVRLDHPTMAMTGV